jgi:hypothetical protein
MPQPNVRAEFPLSEESSGGEVSPLETLVVSRGTEGSNPVRSSRESGANPLLIVHGWGVPWMQGAGGIVSSMQDVSRWARALRGAAPG